MFSSFCAEEKRRERISIPQHACRTVSIFNIRREIYPTGCRGAHTAPMRLNARKLTQHRIARIAQWARLWLKWFDAFLRAAGPLAAPAERIARAWLAEFYQLATLMVLAAR